MVKLTRRFTVFGVNRLPQAVQVHADAVVRPSQYQDHLSSKNQVQLMRQDLIKLLQTRHQGVIKHRVVREDLASNQQG